MYISSIPFLAMFSPKIFGINPFQISTIIIGGIFFCRLFSGYKLLHSYCYLIALFLYTIIFGVISISYSDYGFFDSLEVPIKILYFLASYEIIRKINLSKNCELIGLIIITPLLISFVCFVNDNFYELIRSIWGINNSVTWRFGGVYGEDVNTFGMYSVLTLIFFSMSTKFCLMNRFFTYFAILLSIFSVLISGMRVGIYAILVASFFISDMSFYKKYLSKILISVITLYVVAKNLDIQIIENIVNRFSFDYLYNDFDPDGDGNLNTAINYFNEVVISKISISDIFFGINPALIYVDNIYIELFLSYGIVITATIIILMISLLVKNYNNKLIFFFIIFIYRNLRSNNIISIINNSFITF
jgi:hypothetical protein